MKLKSVSCTQFAGVRDRNVSFTDGINVIYGKNESGKSTLVNLIARTLFQNAKLDGRKDKDFFELYFPSAKKGSRTAGDFADGRIIFETDDGTYTLSKEWGADARCTLSTPDGVIRDQNKINNILADALLYGEGVYVDMLFSSQRNTDVSLQTILDASKKTDAKQEITNVVSQAFAESDGISVNAIEQAIAAKIDELAGKHWDSEMNAPKRKTGGGRWSVAEKDVNKDKVLKAYYVFEDTKDALKKISVLERDADDAAKNYTDKDSAARTAEDAYTRFNTFASRLAVQSERKKTIHNLREKLEKAEDILSKWPQFSENLKNAGILKTEKANRAIFDLWNFVSDARAELSDEDYATAELPYPESGEISNVRKFLRDISSLENKLCGMNLNAAIQILGGNQVHLVSLRTGEPVDVSGGIVSITEAVKITVPGVMEMQLSPADVDVAAVEGEISQLKEKIHKIISTYNVESLEELETYAQKIDTAKAKIERVNTKITRVLGSISLQQLEELYKQAGSVHRSKEEIDLAILAVCKGSDISKFVAQTETIIDGYKTEYGTISNLEETVSGLKAELQKVQNSLDDAEGIPAEYLSIADPEKHLEQLKRNMDNLRDERETALTKKTTAANTLDTYKDAHPEACPETVEKAEQNFEEIKSLLNHWLHIQKAFQAQKEKIHDNPMQDIAANFTRYLSVISEGKIFSEFPVEDKLEMNIYSDNRLLDYGKLSEGTKETVSLAFRLAVLDHLFPDGGGVIVFDDPFTDMDANRTAQSCELIQECAKRHQVIFLTCKEEYLDALKGNQIHF